MTSGERPPVDNLVLLYSYSFEDGAILTKEAFMEFLKCAVRDEVGAAEYYFIKPEQGSYLSVPFITSVEVRQALLGTLLLQ